jgi:hypothetical protein
MNEQLELFPSVLDKARELIDGDRQKDYGPADENFAAIAAFWSIYLSVSTGNHVELTGKNVSHLMALLKIARLARTPTHEDSVIDAIGYLGLSERVR